MNQTPPNYVNNIYKRIYLNKYEFELPLHTVILSGNVENAHKILEIYETDLQFIERLLNCDSKFWLMNTILIGYGDQECSTIGKLYCEYQTVESCKWIDKDKCVVILLKSDYLTPVNVICLSPETKEGKMITLRMVKYVYCNGTIDINAKNSKMMSLLGATGASGMFHASNRLLRLGAEIDVLELVSISMRYGQLEYLDNAYNKFGFKMFDIFTSNEYFTNIFGQDNWPVFEYVVHAIMKEAHLNWRDIVNYERVIRDRWTGNEHNTVFHHAINDHHYGIAERIFQYSDCQTQTSRCTCLPINELVVCAESNGLVIKMLEIDPMQLEIMEGYNEDGYSIFHKLISISSLKNVNKIYEKYPAVKPLFFKHEVGLKFIYIIIFNKQYELVKFIVTNSSEISHSMLYRILNKIIESGDDNVDLFRYVMSLEGFSFILLSTTMRDALFRNALLKRSYKIFQILMEVIQCDLNQIEVSRARNLLHLVLGDNLTSHQIFNMLLRKRVNFKIICDTSKNLLHYSVAANNFFITKKLLELHVCMDKYDENGYLPKHYAKTVEIFKLLNTWTSKSYVNTKTRYHKCSPLHLFITLAAGEDSNKLIKYILDNGGNVNARDNELRTPVLLVRDTKRFKLLQKHKPDLNIIAKDGTTIIKHFLRVTVNPKVEIFNLISEDKILLQLLKCQQQVSQNLLYAIQVCPKLSAELLKEPDIDVSIRDGNNNSLLHIAIQARNLSVIDKLIEKGVSIESRNNQKETPLLLMCDRLSYVQYNDLMILLKYSPDVNVRNGYNMSPILLATQQQKHEHDIVFELLLRGANILDRKLPNRETAYDNLSADLQKLLKFFV